MTWIRRHCIAFVNTHDLSHEEQVALFERFADQHVGCGLLDLLCEYVELASLRDEFAEHLQEERTTFRVVR